MQCSSEISLPMLHVFSETGKFVIVNPQKCERQKYLWNVIVLQEKPKRDEKTKPQTATTMSLWFWVSFACSELYAVIGHHTINIPEIFQVFSVFCVWQ